MILSRWRMRRPGQQVILSSCSSISSARTYRRRKLQRCRTGQHTSHLLNLTLDPPSSLHQCSSQAVKASTSPAPSPRCFLGRIPRSALFEEKPHKSLSRLDLLAHPFFVPQLLQTTGSKRSQRKYGLVEGGRVFSLRPLCPLLCQRTKRKCI